MGWMMFTFETINIKHDCPNYRLHFTTWIKPLKPVWNHVGHNCCRYLFCMWFEFFISQRFWNLILASDSSLILSISPRIGSGWEQDGLSQPCSRYACDHTVHPTKRSASAGRHEMCYVGRFIELILLFMYNTLPLRPTKTIAQCKCHFHWTFLILLPYYHTSSQRITPRQPGACYERSNLGSYSTVQKPCYEARNLWFRTFWKAKSQAIFWVEEYTSLDIFWQHLGSTAAEHKISLLFCSVAVETRWF